MAPAAVAPRTLSYVRAAGARAFRGYPNPARLHGGAEPGGTVALRPMVRVDCTR